ncbi:hypothetical protein ACFLUB_00295 [Chloroflexota bacterium]
MVSLVFIVSSATLGIITSLTAPEINAYLEPWSLRIAIGFTVFLIVQFLILTPIRMWRDSVWVVNIEKGLDGLWDLHDEGVILLNEHFTFMQDTPSWSTDVVATNQWVKEWSGRVEEWERRMNTTLADFAPAEARRLKNIITFAKPLGGLNNSHIHTLNILRERLERFGKIIERHHPALLPE